MVGHCAISAGSSAPRPQPQMERKPAQWEVPAHAHRPDRAGGAGVVRHAGLHGQRHCAVPPCAGLSACSRRRQLGKDSTYAVRVLGLPAYGPAFGIALGYDSGNDKQAYSTAMRTARK